MHHQPQLIQVDPKRIKFSPRNPHKHRGAEYLRLTQSLKTVGMVQFPTVRVLTAGFFECIDGEGRVRSAQEADLPWIWAISFDILDDDEALLMLQAANTARSFTYLAQCRGMADLYLQGHSVSSLTEKFSESKSTIQIMINIGSWPEDLLTSIEEAIFQSQEQANRWTPTLLRELLPLRQEVPGQEPHPYDDDGRPLPYIYDYQEVRLAVQKVLQGDILDSAKMIAYVSERRLELFQEHFNALLQRRLETELEQARQALESATFQQVIGAKEETTRLYEGQVKQLKQQVATLQKRQQEMVKEVSKRPEIVAKLELELQQQLQQTEEERKQVQWLREQMQEEAKGLKHRLKAEMALQLETDLKVQKQAADKRFAQSQADLEAYYAQRDKDRQLQVEKTVQQLIVHGTELLAETQQCLLHLISPGMIKGVTWMKGPELISLIAQMRAVRATLDQAEDKLLHSDSIASTEAERSSSNGSSPPR